MTYLVGEEHPFVRVVVLRVKPGIASKVNGSIWESVEHYLLEKHLIVVLVLYQNGTHRSEIRRNLETWFISKLIIVLRCLVCVRTDGTLL